MKQLAGPKRAPVHVSVRRLGGLRRARIVVPLFAAAIASVLAVFVETGQAAGGTSSWTTPGSYSLTIPAGITAISVDVAGAGGGGGYYVNGGSGARIQATMAVTPLETLTIVVGGGGVSSNSHAAAGGGASAVAHAGALGVVAGGGGGSCLICGGNPGDAGIGSPGLGGTGGGAYAGALGGSGGDGSGLGGVGGAAGTNGVSGASGGDATDVSPTGGAGGAGGGDSGAGFNAGGFGSGAGTGGAGGWLAGGGGGGYGGGGGGGNTYGRSGGGGSGGGGGSAIGAGVTSPVYALSANGGGRFTSGGDGAVTITLVAATPGQPTNAAAAAGDRQATITWTTPVNDGGATITGYTATASPGGQTCSWTSGPLTCTVDAIDNGTTYTFTVTATNSSGTGSASAPSAAVTPAAPAVSPPTPAPQPTPTPAPAPAPAPTPAPPAPPTPVAPLAPTASVPTVDLRATGWGQLALGTIRFRLTARNSWSGSAFNVVLTAQLSRTAARVVAPPNCTVSGRTVTCRAGTIGSGDSMAFTINVTTGTQATVNARVSVSGSQVDRDGGNNTTLVLGQPPLVQR